MFEHFLAFIVSQIVALSFGLLYYKFRVDVLSAQEYATLLFLKELENSTPDDRPDIIKLLRWITDKDSNQSIESFWEELEKEHPRSSMEVRYTEIFNDHKSSIEALNSLKAHIKAVHDDFAKCRIKEDQDLFNIFNRIGIIL
jgi:hypothetical protein